jgi:hypothetical protein
MDWSKVYSPHDVGGLGLRRISLFDKALLCKWLWRYAVEIKILLRLVGEQKCRGREVVVLRCLME